MNKLKHDGIVVPSYVAEEYLIWLRKPVGAAFQFSVVTRFNRIVYVELPLVHVRK